MLFVSTQPEKVTHPNGLTTYVVNDQFHRLDGPAEITPTGTEYWYQHGILHRADGPAVTSPDGRQAWYFNGEMHRDGGPALILPGGSEIWYQHGLMHRDDGPAEITVSFHEPTTRRWYWHGWHVLGLSYEHPLGLKNLNRYLALSTQGRLFIQDKYVKGHIWDVNLDHRDRDGSSRWGEWLDAAFDLGL